MFGFSFAAHDGGRGLSALTVADAVTKMTFCAAGWQWCHESGRL